MWKSLVRSKSIRRVVYGEFTRGPVHVMSTRRGYLDMGAESRSRGLFWSPAPFSNLLSSKRFTLPRMPPPGNGKQAHCDPYSGAFSRPFSGARQEPKNTDPSPIPEGQFQGCSTVYSGSTALFARSGRSGCIAQDRPSCARDKRGLGKQSESRAAGGARPGGLVADTPNCIRCKRTAWGAFLRTHPYLMAQGIIASSGVMIRTGATKESHGRGSGRQAVR
jgi:hypothetical protein